ncbi:MAG TPA: ribosome maturation factor RimM [Nitrospinota bacterium]|jgi:16S rRNA processing protein RimM|nr:ribosome maturation factor RimM [Nitrospinota bacterium]|tara:strand:+ start:165157 stop:165675 length:519 start_codon:yes stop_codon:yes gene_type:complete
MKIIKIAIARIHRNHGVSGEIRVKPFFGEALMKNLVGSEVELSSDRTGESFYLLLDSIRQGGRTLLAKFVGIDSPEEAHKLIDMVIIAPRNQLPNLPEGQYYLEEIIGLDVIRTNGKRIGSLKGFFSAGEKDVWEIVTDEGDELLFPCIPEVLKSVDLEKRLIIVEPMEMDE